MIDLLTTSLARGYGPSTRLLRAKFDGQAATAIALAEQLGIKSIVQSSTTSGLFTVTLQNKYAEFAPMVWAESAHANMHDCIVYGKDFSAGTFTFAHYTQTARTGAQALTNGNSPLCTFNVLVLARGAL